MERDVAERSLQRQSDPVLYCVVPPRLAKIQPRLCEHFANDPDVEVVVDKRVGERRFEAPLGSAATAEEGLSSRLSPGMDRRVADGRRSAVPVDKAVSLPRDLRRYSRDLIFLSPHEPALSDPAAGVARWRGRCLAAERAATELAGALLAASDALRSREGLSPRRFRQLAKAEAALERYYEWRLTSDDPSP
jgi:hypothetical protein